MDRRKAKGLYLNQLLFDFLSSFILSSFIFGGILYKKKKLVSRQLNYWTSL